MRKYLFLLVVIGLSGCGNDDEATIYTFTGQVLQYPDLTPAANADISLSTTVYRDQVQGPYELRSGKTDANGNYEFQISAEEFSTSLFLYENHPSYSINIRKSGFIQLPNFRIGGLFPGGPINPGEPIVGTPINPIGNPPEDYFEKEIKLGRESFLSFSAESLSDEADSIYLIIYHVVPSQDDPNQEEDRFFKSFIFHQNYQAGEIIGGFPVSYLGRLRNDFPMDTTLVESMSFDPHSKLNISWTQYTGTDSLKFSKEINLQIGESVEVFE